MDREAGNGEDKDLTTWDTNTVKQTNQAADRQAKKDREVQQTENK